MKKISKVLSLMLVGLCLIGAVGCSNTKDGEDMISKSSDTAAVVYKDGEYKASADNYDDQGYKPTVKIVVDNGVLYSVDCDAESKNEGTKKADSESGQYNMKQGGSQYEWHEEIAFFEKHVVKNGVESIRLDDSGKTDAISGCTIAVKEYVDLIKEALNKAKE